MAPRNHWALRQERAGKQALKQTDAFAQHESSLGTGSGCAGTSGGEGLPLKSLLSSHSLSLEHVSPTSLLIPALNLPPEVSVGVGGANANEGGEGIVWVGGAPAGVGGAPWEWAGLA